MDKEEMKQTVLEAFETSLANLHFYWREFGITTEQTTDRTNSVLNHILNLMDELVKEEKSLYENLKEGINKYLEDLEVMTTLLDVENTLPDENLSLVQKEKFLRDRLSQLEGEKHKRIKQFQQLQHNEAKLCNLLGMPQNPPIFDVVPTMRELCELEQHVHMLNDERDLRHNRYAATKRELTTIAELTEFSPDTSFEREVICYDDDTEFVLSKENLDQLKQTLVKVQQLKVNVENEVKSLTGYLKDLWARLGIEEKMKREFLEKHSSCKQSTIKALKQEIERCEEIKKQNMQMYISKQRDELLQLWDACCVSQRDREKFESFYSTDYTEELLDAHETEVQRWKSFFEETKIIFKKIDQRELLWEKFMVFEKKARDPSRYNNRGGNLLQEERSRNRLKKDLPKLEEDILNEIQRYEDKHDTLFLYKGTNFHDYIKKQWDQHMQEKENEKLERLKKKEQELQVRKTPAKRPMNMTAATAPSKMYRSGTKLSMVRGTTLVNKFATPSPMMATTSKIREVRTTSRRSPRLANKRNLRILSEQNTGASPAFENTKDATTYSNFAMELDKNSRSRCRSSVVHGRKVVYGSKVMAHDVRNPLNSSNFRSSKLSPGQVMNKSRRNLRTRTPTKLETARSKVGVPFII